MGAAGPSTVSFSAGGGGCNTPAGASKVALPGWQPTGPRRKKDAVSVPRTNPRHDEKSGRVFTFCPRVDMGKRGKDKSIGARTIVFIE